MVQKYLTDDGFERPTLSELVQQIGDQLFNALGPINRNPASGIGQMIGIYAEALGVSYEVAEELFNSRFIRSASGLALDAFGDWLGLPRRARTNTSSPVILYGDNGTMVLAGSLASYANHNFAVDVDTAISNANATDVTYRISTSIGVGETVAVRVGSLGQKASYTAAQGDTASSVARELARQIDLFGASSPGVIFKSSATGTDIRIWTDNLSTGFTTFADGSSTLDRISMIRLGSPGDVTAVETGPIVVPAHQLTKPVTAIAGWVGIDNPVDASTGTDRESDTDYRRRLLASDGTVNGLATQAAIKRVVMAVPGVSAVTVLVNNKMYNDTAGQVPKSYQVVVNGGQPSAIVEAIYNAGGAGIETYGTEQDTYRDADGSLHIIYFSTPTAVEYTVKVKISFLDAEETLTPTYDSIIKQAVREYFASLSLGEDIVPQRIYGPIYASTEGIAQMDLEFRQGGNVVTPVNGVIAVGPTNTAILADNGVTVEAVQP